MEITLAKIQNTTEDELRKTQGGGAPNESFQRIYWRGKEDHRGNIFHQKKKDLESNCAKARLGKTEGKGTAFR